MTELEALLCAIEDEGHEAGWDSFLCGPMIFEVREIDGHLDMFFPVELNMLIFQLCQKADISDVLLYLADRAEQVRGMMNGWGFNAEIGEGLMGLGLRTEAFTIETDTLPENTDLSQHPKSRETRIVHYYGRDNRKVHVMRFRDNDRVAVKDVSAEIVGGGIANGLTRILNAMVQDEVEIAPADPTS